MDLKLISESIKPLIENKGLEFVDIAFDSSKAVLTVYVDTFEQNIDLDTLEQVSIAIDPVLDEIITDSAPYTLNVSSPGLDRPIKSDRDYERNTGREVELKLYASLKGRKKYEGILRGTSGNCAVIELPDGQIVNIEKNRIALMTKLIKFS